MGQIASFYLPKKRNRLKKAQQYPQCKDCEISTDKMFTIVNPKKKKKPVYEVSEIIDH